MTEPIEFFVEGDPKPQPRPRAFARRVGNTFQARVYDAGTAENWKSRIADAAKDFRPDEPIREPISVRLEFWFARPKSHYRTGKHAGELKPDAPIWHTAPRDIDNLWKAVIDCLTQIGFFADDGLIAHSIVAKMYSPTVTNGKCFPGVLVRINVIK
jgi:Holliday junction resolvase RusA-like endonuclease